MVSCFTDMPLNDAVLSSLEHLERVKDGIPVLGGSMLVHHDSRPYEVAAAEARNKALEIINNKIALGRTNAEAVIEKVQREVPKDFIVQADRLSWDAADNGQSVRIMHSSLIGDSLTGGAIHGLHRHALNQAAARAEIPMQYVNTLLENKQADLLAHNFKQRFTQIKPRVLLRDVDGEIRGFLSDRYRRLDARPILDSFIGAIQKIGALPYDGYALDTKIAIQAILPAVYEPVPNEVVAFVLSLSNSDFGNGAVELRMSVLRIWCTNLAMGEEMLRQIHLGKRLSDNLVYSERTYELDGATVVSALNDTVQHVLSEETRIKYLEAVRSAHEQKIDPWKVKDHLKKVIGKEDAEKVIEAFNSPDVEMLPPGNTAWRMSNAISWIAGKEDNGEKRLDLMKVAGDYLKVA